MGVSASAEYVRCTYLQLAGLSMRQTARSSSITVGTFALVGPPRSGPSSLGAILPDRFLLLLPQTLRCAGAGANEEEVQSLFSARHRGISCASGARAATQWPIPALQSA